MKKISPQRYVQIFCAGVVILALARQFYPQIVHPSQDAEKTDSIAMVDTTAIQPAPVQKIAKSQQPFTPHRIYSVSSFDKCFPDQNDVQLIAAEKNGVNIVKDRTEAEQRKDELVYIGSNPYFTVDKAKSSIPYLVPSAATLLQDIGTVFLDSLQIKDIPLHKVIVTSVLRTQDDVEKLLKHNTNAAPNSCHRYGTTFDICYNRYTTVEDPDGVKRRPVTNDTLKWVLSEVLNDFRKQERCYIKYEKKQSCFHITVR